MTQSDDDYEHYKFLYDALRARQSDESDRIDKIDTKIAALLAGLMVAFGFLYEHLTWWQALLLVVPFGLLLCAFWGRDWVHPPKPQSALDNMDKGVRWKTEALVKAIAKSIDDNRAQIKLKAVLMNVAIVVIFILILAASGFKVFDSRHGLGVEKNGRTAATTARGQRADGRRHQPYDGPRGEGRQKRQVSPS